MKMLEVVAENLIAQGGYAYFRNGVLTDVRETWAVCGWPDGTHCTRAARHAPSFGSVIQVEAWGSAEGISRFKVAWENTLPEAVPQTNATYTITTTKITVERTLSGAPQPSVQLPTPPNLVVSPLLRCFQGPAIRRVAGLGRGERVPVLVPWIHDPGNAELLLTPQLDPRSAQKLSTKNGVDCYAYVGGNYDDAARFWLNGDDQMVKYEFGEWRVESRP